MQTISRDVFLSQLESVNPGVSPKDLVEQSSCFVFKDGRIITYNDEVACSSPTEINIEGAVKAAPLINLLRKMDDDEIQIGESNSYLVIKGTNGRGQVIREPEILLPFDGIELPKKWKSLPEDFGEAINYVSKCAGSDASRFALTCVHFTADMVEACDNFQLMRYELPTGIPTDVLIRKDSIIKLAGVDMVKVGHTDKWLHFKNSVGLIMSFRVHTDTYPDLTKIAEAKGEKAVLPKIIGKAAERSSVFSAEIADANRVTVSMGMNKIRIHGIGNLGDWKESHPMKYSGPKIKFLIHPDLIIGLAANHNECEVSETRLVVKGDKFRYVACLEQDTSEPEKEEPKKKRKKSKA